MFANRNSKAESWVEFNEKFGRQGSQTRLLNQLKVAVGRSDKTSRVVRRSTKSFDGSCDNLRPSFRRGSSFDATRGSIKTRQSLVRHKSQGNIKIGKVSHRMSAVSHAA